MAKIKKIQEQGQTIYPATITNAVKDPETGKTLPELLGDGVQSNGTYPKMTVGFAQEIVGDGSATPEEFSFRPTAGEERNVANTTYYEGERNGVARIEKIKGNSVVHNQLLANDAKFGYENENAMGFWYVRQGAGNYSLSNNGITLYFNSGTSSIPSIGQNVGFKKSHKYLINMDVIFNGQFDDYRRSIYMGFGVNCNDTNAQSLETFLVPYRSLTQFSLQFIVEANVDAPYFVIAVRKYTNNVGESLTINNAMIVDLTKEFTAGNEPTTKEEFWQKVVVGKNLNERNTGEIIDGNYGGIKTVGFNAFNGTYAKVCGGVPYYLGGNYTSLGFTTEEGGTLEAITIPTSAESVGTTPSDRLYTPLQNGYIYAEGENININISWGTEYGYLNGTYQPYKPFERDLSWVANCFPNGMRSAGNVRDEIRFNSSTQKWEAVQRVGTFTIGEINWTAVGDGRFYADIADLAAPTDDSGRNKGILCGKYLPSTQLVPQSMDDKSILRFNSGSTVKFYIKDASYTDTATFKNDLQNVVCNYALATPIVTEITEDINMDFDVSDYGTEELIVEEGKASAPIVADITYAPNALSTLKQVPDILKRLKALESAVASATATTNEEETVE